MNVRITAYLDGQTVGIGYKFVVTKGPTSWRAYATNKGFKRFLDLFGLKIDTSKTELHDCRACGKGRVVTMVCCDKEVSDDHGGFWTLDQVPKSATPYVDLSNGEYTQCYILDEGRKVTVYRPNPNAKEVYKPLDYRTCRALYN